MNLVEYFLAYSHAIKSKALSEAAISILDKKRELGLISNSKAEEVMQMLNKKISEMDLLEMLILAPSTFSDHEKWLEENRAKLTPAELEFATLSERPISEVAKFLKVTTRAVVKGLAEGRYEAGLNDEPKKRSILTRSVIEAK
jgi:hypothetical protein